MRYNISSSSLFHHRGTTRVLNTMVYGDAVVVVEFISSRGGGGAGGRGPRRGENCIRLGGSSRKPLPSPSKSPSLFLVWLHLRPLRTGGAGEEKFSVSACRLSLRSSK